MIVRAHLTVLPRQTQPAPTGCPTSRPDARPADRMHDQADGCATADKGCPTSLQERPTRSQVGPDDSAVRVPVERYRHGRPLRPETRPTRHPSAGLHLVAGQRLDLGTRSKRLGPPQPLALIEPSSWSTDSYSCFSNQAVRSSSVGAHVATGPRSNSAEVVQAPSAPSTAPGPRPLPCTPDVAASDVAGSCGPGAVRSTGAATAALRVRQFHTAGCTVRVSRSMSGVLKRFNITSPSARPRTPAGDVPKRGEVRGELSRQRHGDRGPGPHGPRPGTATTISRRSAAGPPPGIDCAVRWRPPRPGP
jgi:hypothetical protein